MYRLLEHLVATGVVGLIGISAHAASIPVGSVEIGPVVAIDHASVRSGSRDLGSVTSARLVLGWGYFTTPTLEFRAGLVAEHVRVAPQSGRDSDATAVGGQVGLAVRFPVEGHLIPYVAVDVGAVSHTGDGAGDVTSFLFPAIGVGIRTPFGDSGLVTTGIAYEHVRNADGFEEVSSHHVTLRLGISLLRRAPHEEG